jgi:hypothetical protein
MTIFHVVHREAAALLRAGWRALSRLSQRSAELFPQNENLQFFSHLPKHLFSAPSYLESPLQTDTSVSTLALTARCFHNFVTRREVGYGLTFEICSLTNRDLG